MPRPADKRSADELAEDVADHYLKFVKLVKGAGDVASLSVMELVIATDELNVMKKDLSKLVKSLQDRLRLKVIEKEQLAEVEETPKKIKLKPIKGD